MAEAEANPSFGGYDDDFVSEVEDELQCAICTCGGVFEQLARYTMRYQESDLHLAFILLNLLTTSAYSTCTLLLLLFSTNF